MPEDNRPKAVLVLRGTWEEILAVVCPDGEPDVTIEIEVPRNADSSAHQSLASDRTERPDRN